MDITIRGLKKTFGEKPILRGVDLDVPAGATVALIGPSGGGKSTLLRCINGLNTFDEGAIRVGSNQLGPGATNRAQVAEVRRMLGMVFQDYQLFPHLTAAENIMEAPRQVLGLNYFMARARALELLRQVGLEDRAHYYPRQLSGGQKQRVAIARALAMQPKCLLCDEITAALDPELKGEVLAVLENLKRAGMTIVMVTHEIGFARRAADFVAVLAEGGVAEAGPPDQVIDRPTTERTRLFLSRVLG